MLIERFLGPGVVLGGYLLNCAVSAATTTVVHRQIGFKKVQQRGRFSNTNGNMTLFFTSLFTTLAPNYYLYAGQYVKVGFLYILAFYGILFFT